MATLAAAANAGDVERCEALLAETDVNAKDVFHRTPLIQAAMGGHAAVIELLMRARAQPSAGDRLGWTALHWAAFQNTPEVVRSLLVLRADPLQADKEGGIPRNVIEHILEEQAEGEYGHGLQKATDFSECLELLAERDSDKHGQGHAHN
eukprot:gnl/TRDRNA2_/TRDRNA2_82200_c0_seq3.p1 gnl/TRDRNA2_/TRDRNA2_82200_c0~~gnl/TRDRNA2_/TRDRNA2_82200_c0_seq3.p1  ORF type:complete len:157 (-),score=27.81 gnl/TRDRNA2_/TRDRNA2_82200_c0_seq3:44-493(-)